MHDTPDRPFRLCAAAPRALVLAAAFTAASLPAGAITSAWIANGSGNWSAPGNWNNGVPTNAGDVAYFTNTLAAASTITVDTPVSLGTLRIGPVAFRYNFAAGNSITMDSGGGGHAVIQQTGSQQNYGPASLVMNSDLDINNNGSAYFNLTGTIISGNHDIFVNANGAGGTPYVAQNNTFAGNVTISSGKLMNTGGDPFGSLTNGARLISIINNAAFRLNGNVNPLGTNRIVVVGAGGAQFDMNAKLFTLNGSGQLTGPNTLSILNSAGTGGTVTIGGANNTFSGSLLMNNGTALRLSAGGSLSSAPVISMAHTGCLFDVSAKVSGYAVPSNQVLAGVGWVTGLVNMAAAATLHPGSYALPGPTRSPGVITLAGGCTISDGGTYAWDLAQLKDNAYAPGTTTYSSLTVTNGAVNLAGGKLAISFLNGIATPATANAFWQTNHVWTILTAATSPSGTLAVVDGTYAHWAFTTRVNENTLELVYGPLHAAAAGHAYFGLVA